MMLGIALSDFCNALPAVDIKRTCLPAILEILISFLVTCIFTQLFRKRLDQRKVLRKRLFAFGL